MRPGSTAAQQSSSTGFGPASLNYPPASLTQSFPPLATPAAVVPGNPLDDVKLLVDTVGSLLRANALRSAASKGVNVSFGSKSNEEKLSAV